MNEAGWQESTDPGALLACAQERTGDRKVRLFACACVRRVWDRLADPRSRAAVAVAERFADGTASRAELDRAEDAAWQLVSGVSERTPAEFAALIAWQAAFRIREAGPRDFIERVLRASGQVETYAGLTDLLRDVVGNPFRPAHLAPGVLVWNDRCVVNLARSLYDQGQPTDLPVLGDALEEAGCADEEILAHCRRPGPHVRGCWVVDAVLAQA